MKNAMPLFNVKWDIHTDFFECLSDGAFHWALLGVNFALRKAVFPAFFIYNQQDFSALRIQDNAAISRDFSLIFVEISQDLITRNRQVPQEWSRIDDDVDEILEGEPMDGKVLADKIYVVIVAFLWRNLSRKVIKMGLDWK